MKPSANTPAAERSIAVSLSLFFWAGLSFSFALTSPLKTRAGREADGVEFWRYSGHDYSGSAGRSSGAGAWEPRDHMGRDEPPVNNLGRFMLENGATMGDKVGFTCAIGPNIWRHWPHVFARA